MRVLLVGESNPFGGDSRFDLWPEPSHCSGGRLARILGMNIHTYLKFERTNLLRTSLWDVKLARSAAGQLRALFRVLLGARVSAAHGVPYEPFTVFRHDKECVAAQRTTARIGGQPCVWPCSSWDSVLVLPHPSGRCRAWNNPEAHSTARSMVEDFVAAASRA